MEPISAIPEDLCHDIGWKNGCIANKPTSLLFKNGYHIVGCVLSDTVGEQVLVEFGSIWAYGFGV